MELSTAKSSSLSAHQTTDGNSTSVQKSAKRSKVTQHQIYRMLSMYENPAYKVSDIAKTFGFTVPVLYHYLDRSGIPYERRHGRSPRITPKQISQIKALALSGISPALIAKHVGVARSSVHRHIKGMKDKQKAKPAVIKPAAAPQYQEQERQFQVTMIESPSLWQRFKTWLLG